MPHWLSKTNVPLFVSDTRLRKRKSLPVALGPWALDSGGFTQLSQHGSWDRVSPADYADRVRLYQAEIGGMLWAAIQDWMCEPWILENTGLTIREHQEKTIASLLTLRSIAPDVPWAPVLQGWQLSDYVNMVGLYAEAGVDLTRESVVGLGSVCRRQATSEIAALVRELASGDLSLHGFGVKIRGFDKYGPLLKSADTLAWSYDARWLRETKRTAIQQTLGCVGHKNCANCFEYAMHWRGRVLSQFEVGAPSRKVPNARQENLRTAGV